MLLKTQKLSTKSCDFFWGVGYLAKQQTVAFGADSDHDTDPGILTEFIPLQGVARWISCRCSLFGLSGCLLSPIASTCSFITYLLLLCELRIPYRAIRSALEARVCYQSTNSNNNICRNHLCCALNYFSLSFNHPILYEKMAYYIVGWFVMTIEQTLTLRSPNWFVFLPQSCPCLLVAYAWVCIFWLTVP